MGAIINWLHLSDLHFRERNKSKQISTLQKIATDIEIRSQSLSERTEIDVVFFSGDMVFDGKGYDEFDEGLEELFEVFHRTQEGRIPTLIPVPGNHDVERPPKKGYPKDSKKQRIFTEFQKKLSDQSELQADFWINKNDGANLILEENRDFINERFSNYKEWVEKKRPIVPKFDFEKNALVYGDFAHTIRTNGFRLGVLGLNSSFLQIFDGNYENLLELRFEQATRLFEGTDTNLNKWLESNHTNIFMTHHPLSWLTQNSRDSLQESLFHKGDLPIHLSGHVHIPAATTDSLNFGPTSCYLTAPSLFGMAEYLEFKDAKTGDILAKPKPTQRIHGYTFGQIKQTDNTEVELRVAPRMIRLSKSSGAVLIPDFRFEINEYEGKSFTAPVKIELKKGWAPTSSGNDDLDEPNEKDQGFGHTSPSNHRLGIDSDEVFQKEIAELTSIKEKNIVRFVSRVIRRNDSLFKLSPYGRNKIEPSFSYKNTDDILQIATLSIAIDEKGHFEDIDSDGYMLKRAVNRTKANESLAQIKKGLDELSTRNLSPDVLVVNELSFPYPITDDDESKQLINEAHELYKEFARANECLVVGGSYHNEKNYNVAPIYATNGDRIYCHSRNTNPSNLIKVRTPSSDKILTYPFRFNRLATLICRDSFDPKIIFKLLTNLEIDQPKNRVEVIVVPAFVTDKLTSDYLSEACRDLSFATNSVVCLSNCLGDFQSNGLFVCGIKYSPSHPRFEEMKRCVTHRHFEYSSLYSVQRGKWGDMSTNIAKQELDAIRNAVSRYGYSSPDYGPSGITTYSDL